LLSAPLPLPEVRFDVELGFEMRDGRGVDVGARIAAAVG